MLKRVFAIVLICLPLAAFADDRVVRLHAPQALVETGLLEHILPRFSLKTQVRVTQLPETAEVDVRIGQTGEPLFEGAGQVWRLEVLNPDHAGTVRFVDWLRSEVGRNTVAAFAPEGQTLFAPVDADAADAEVVAITGDAALGHEIALAKCLRCHAVDAATRRSGIGSTPSFGVLRAMPDWETRFRDFYALNPHPAFTQLVGVTDPFNADRPSPITPVQLTPDELEALLAYVATMPAADLGAPIAHQ